jgi:hypothetical protein
VFRCATMAPLLLEESGIFQQSTISSDFFSTHLSYCWLLWRVKTDELTIGLLPRPPRNHPGGKKHKHLKVRWWVWDGGL